MAVTEKAKNYTLNCPQVRQLSYPLPFASKPVAPFRRKGLTQDFIQIVIHLHVRKRVFTLQQKLFANSKCPWWQATKQFSAIMIWKIKSEQFTLERTIVFNPLLKARALSPVCWGLCPVELIFQLPTTWQKTGWGSPAPSTSPYKGECSSPWPSYSPPLDVLSIINAFHV